MVLYRKTYKDCSELPVLNFIKLLTKGDLRQLFSDNDSWRLRPDLQAIWDNIFMEYTELMPDAQGSYIFGLVKEMNVIKSKLSLIQPCVDMLSKTKDLSNKKPTIDTLKSLCGVFLTFTEETIRNDLKSCVNIAKRFVIEYEELYNEYRKLATNEQSKASEIDYMEQIAAIKAIEGVSFDIRTTSTLEYIAYMKNIKAKQK